MKEKNYEIFKYGQTEMEYLIKVDKTLGEVIERMGMVEREIIPDLFTALIHAIVGQQISTKAADTVWFRMRKLFKKITPERISVSSIEEIQQCGLSIRKAGYIKRTGEAVAHGELNLNELYGMSDEEVIKHLCSLHGIGVWTAEMVLLNSMERPNVLSWGDIAIRRGIIKLYGLKVITKEQFNEYKKRYSPYGSVASLYLWKLSLE